MGRQKPARAEGLSQRYPPPSRPLPCTAPEPYVGLYDGCFWCWTLSTHVRRCWIPRGRLTSAVSVGKRDEEERGGDPFIALHPPYFELDRFATCQSLTQRSALGEEIATEKTSELLS